MSESGAEEPTLPAAGATDNGRGQGTQATQRPLRRGAAVDRYVVLGTLGSGGMGVVYAAFDPELDRRVALKFLHPGVAGSDGDDSLMLRLLREAKALARLSHPNVVAVYDVGRHDGGIFIAMALVEGVTLRMWLKARTRARAEVLDVFVAAARGLSAAHGAGIVHRDFKPDNVMVGTDGGVHVVDFGLARARSSASSDDLAAASTTDEPVPAVRASPSEPTLETHGVVGTPAYMSPEQLRGGDVDERSDQFSYCVALYEALYGERPFAAGNLPDLVRAVTAGDLGPTPPDADVPRWLHDRVIRGLSSDPTLRWPSMASLADALARDPVARRRGQVIMVGGVAAVASVGVAAGALIDPAPECTDASPEFERAWGDDRRAAVRGALTRSDAPYAAQTWVRVEQGLDTYAEAWAQGVGEACAATHARARQSEHLFDLRMACLRRARLEVEAFTELLAAADDDVRARAVQGVANLPDLDQCADAKALLAAAPPPADPELRTEVQAVRDALDRAKVQGRVGRNAEAMDALLALRPRAVATGYRPVVGETLGLLGKVQLYQGLPKVAEKSLQEAVWTLFAVGDRMGAANAGAHLSFVIANDLGRPEEGLQWGERAVAIFDEIAPGSAGHAMALSNLGTAHRSAGSYDAAIENLERAVAMREASIDSDPLDLASTLANLAVLYDDTERYEESRAIDERVVEIYETTVGPDHPSVASARANLAVPLFRLGQRDQARAQMERAIELAKSAYGPTHPLLIDINGDYGNMLLESGSPEQAEPYLRRALEATTAAGRETSQHAANLHYAMGQLHGKRGNPHDALTHYQRALSIRREVLGHNHPWVAETLNAVGVTNRALHDNAAALRSLTEGLAVAEGSLPADHTTVTQLRENLGDALALAGRFDEAIAQFTTALPAVERRAGADSAPAAFLRAKIGEAEFEQGHHAAAVTAFSGALVGLQHDPAGAPYVSYVLMRRAEAHLGEGKSALARADIERAEALAPQAMLSETDTARMAFTHARALWECDVQEHPAALRLAADAVSTLPQQDPLAVTITGWIDERR